MILKRNYKFLVKQRFEFSKIFVFFINKAVKNRPQILDNSEVSRPLKIILN